MKNSISLIIFLNTAIVWVDIWVEIFPQYWTNYDLFEWVLRNYITFKLRNSEIAFFEWKKCELSSFKLKRKLFSFELKSTFLNGKVRSLPTWMKNSNVVSIQKVAKWWVSNESDKVNVFEWKCSKFANL